MTTDNLGYEDKKWHCKLSGNCCEIFAPLVFGGDCVHFSKDRTCSNYANRPDVCKTSLLKSLVRTDNFLEGVDIDEYLMARCSLLVHLKRWKDDTKHLPAAQKLILKMIVNAGSIPAERYAEHNLHELRAN